MPEDTVNISLEARIKLLMHEILEKTYREGWTDRHTNNPVVATAMDIEIDWSESEAKRATES